MTSLRAGTDLAVAAGPGLIARVPLEGWVARASLPPAPAVDRLPGARMEGFTVVDAGDLVVQLGCASAPSDRWVPGLEGVVLERATGLAMAPLGLRPGPLERRDAPVFAGATATQRWAGDAVDGRRLELAHVLAFAGEDADAIACSALCLEPAGATACDRVIDGLTIEGTLVPAPPPGPMAGAVLWAAEHPAGAAAIAGAIGLASVAVLLARRPRRPIVARRAAARRRSARSS